MVRFKQRCFRCRKNYVLVSGNQRFAACYDCQKKELSRKIKDPEMKKLFDIPEEFYMKNSFLRDIKLKYLNFRELSENQIKAFKKTVSEMKKEKVKEGKKG